MFVILTAVLSKVIYSDTIMLLPRGVYLQRLVWATLSVSGKSMPIWRLVVACFGEMVTSKRSCMQVLAPLGVPIM